MRLRSQSMSSLTISTAETNTKLVMNLIKEAKARKFKIPSLLLTPAKNITITPAPSATTFLHTQNEWDKSIATRSGEHQRMRFSMEGPGHPQTPINCFPSICNSSTNLSSSSSPLHHPISLTAPKSSSPSPLLFHKDSLADEMAALKLLINDMKSVAEQTSIQIRNLISRMSEIELIHQQTQSSTTQRQENESNLQQQQTWMTEPIKPICRRYIRLEERWENPRQ